MQMCPNCSQDNPDHAQTCMHCGEPLGGLLGQNTLLEGRYRATCVLGCGGMGAVYLADDTRIPGRRVAVKENRPNPSASPSALAQAGQQFLAEASVLARLDHPHLPKVSDYFSQAGRQYLVMDYVEGEDLASVLQRSGGPLPEKPVLIWTDQVLDALAHLHGQRPQPIIHRDIKPANIRLTPQGKVKLVDFGLVKLLDPNDPRTKTVLRGLGTPEYAPLEQYTAGAGHTDTRSDLYSLGATLYHLLTNIAPPDAHQRFLNPAVLRPPRQLNPGLSQATEQAVLRAMEIHPDQRFQTAAEMRQALRRGPAALSVPTGGQPALLRTWLIAGAAGLSGLVGLVVIGVLLRGLLAGGPRPSMPTLTVLSVASTPTSASTHMPWPTDIPVPTATAMPTPTPTHTPTPIPINTPTPLPTDTPTEINTPTSTHTRTATPTPTVVNIPTSVPSTVTPTCSLAPGETFRNIWLGLSVMQRIGCPENQEHVSWTAEQLFQKGYMLWRKDTNQIYVLYNDDTWRGYANTWHEGEPVKLGYAPPPGLYEPIMGFGKVWREKLGGPNAKIGWALEEEGGFDNSLQDFQGGAMFFSTHIGARVTIVLYNDGHWERY
jgi:serine/threonine protein kinase